MSPRLLAVRLVIGLKRVSEAMRLRRRADVYVDCVAEWRYPAFLMRALRRCDIGVVEVPERAALASWGADGFWNFVLRTRLLPAGEEPTAPVVIAREPDGLGEHARSRIRISVDWFSRDAQDDNLVMPYFAHPDLQRLGRMPTSTSPRPIRVGFAGTVAEDVYRKKFAFPMPGRPDVLRTIADRFGSRVAVVESEAALAAVDPGLTPIVLVVVRERRDATRKHVLQGRAYLSFLERCSFFIAPPGFRMPLCHNLIEAMSVGTVPILSYGNWLHPPLCDGIDSLRFETLDELQTVVEQALAMSEDDIRMLRSGVSAYYEDHLSVDSFAQKLCPQLERSPTIVVNSERDSAALWRARQPGSS
jgi:hypothetical protein